MRRTLPGPGCLASRRRCSRSHWPALLDPGRTAKLAIRDSRRSGADDRLLDGRRWRHVIQDALAAVALNDLIVGANLLEDLRAKADVTCRAQPVTRGGCEGGALARARDLVEQREQSRLECLRQFAAT